MKCINKSHPEYISLLENNPYPVPLLDAKISIWQDQNSTDKFPTLDQLAQPVGDSKIRYEFKATAAIINKLDKVKQWYKSLGDTDKFWNKLQQDLQIPKEQIVLLKESDGNTIEEKILDFTTKYNQVIEITTAKEKLTGRIAAEEGMYVKEENGKYYLVDAAYSTKNEITKKEYEDFNNDKQIPTHYYSNLTVPGGTNYTENEIATPAITPSIKGHAQFSTDKGIGWFRSDDKISEQKKEYSDLLNKNRLEDAEKLDELKKTKDLPTSTRRILEVQSDLFQKGRDKEDLTYDKEVDGQVNQETGDFKVEKEAFDINDKGYRFFRNSGKYYETEILTQSNGIKVDVSRKEITKEEFDSKYKLFLKVKPDAPQNNFLQLLNKDNNWVTFFIKSIIQDSAKETTQEVQQEDVEAKVRELEKEGLLEIDCKGKLKAEKGLATSFTKGGKWKVIKDLKGYPTHKEGGVDLTIGKDGVNIKNGNTQFTAKHGLVIPKN